jgi:hypothetical protein
MKKALFMSLALAAAAFAAAQGSLELRLSPGSAYAPTKWFGPVPVRLHPQIALWVETDRGGFVDTIYVTERAAKAKWRAAGGASRPESLPIWSHARGVAGADGGYLPDRGSPLPDAVTGATPGAAFTKTWTLPEGLQPGAYRVRAELNLSYDWNKAYPDKLPASDPRRSEANGQPSVLWEAVLTLGEGRAEAALKPVGTGSVNGSDGSLRPGLEGITSALDIVAAIQAVYRP